MRELNEYTAEVRKRIDEKLAARRRNRRRILACAASLILVLAVGAAALPGLLRSAKGRTTDAASHEMAAVSDEMAMDTAPRTEDPTEAVETQPFLLCSTELWVPDGEGQWRKSETQPRDPAALTAWLLEADPEAFPGDEGLESMPEDGLDHEGPADDLPEDDGPEGSGDRTVLLILTDPSGAAVGYRFTGTELIRIDTEQPVPLTEAQISELKVLLFGGD